MTILTDFRKTVETGVDPHLQTELLKTTVHINVILVGLFGIHLLSHADIFPLYRSIFYVSACVDCVRYNF